MESNKTYAATAAAAVAVAQRQIDCARFNQRPASELQIQIGNRVLCR